MASAAVLVAGGAYPRYRIQGVLSSDYTKGVAVDLFGADESANIFTILATGGYLLGAGSAVAYDITMPDVIGLAGFPATSRLTPGNSLVVATGFGFTGTGIFDLRPVLGGELKAAARSAVLVVP